MSMTIAKLAKAGGVGVDTVRYYQRRGLLAEPGRSQGGGGFRHYGDPDVRRLRFIRKAQGAGFTLQEIGELLALDATDDRAKARVLALSRVATLDARIADMTAARDALSKLAKACGASAAGPCPIVGAFES